MKKWHNRSKINAIKSNKSGARWLKMDAQYGFGLLEMMVAILLGSMLILMMVQTDAIAAKQSIQAQKSASSIDEMAGGIVGIREQLRLAGLGQGVGQGFASPQGVMVFDSQFAGLQTDMKVQSLMSQSNLPSKIAVPSDQLTISYVAPMDMWDCEGQLVLGARQVRLTNGELVRIDGQVVIERYFVQAEKDNTLSLRCNASSFVMHHIERDGTRDKRGLSAAYQNAIIDHHVIQNRREDDKAVKNAFQLRGASGVGEILLGDVGGFWVRLLVDTGRGIRQMTIDEYRTAFANNPKPIVALNVAILHQGDVIGGQDGQKITLFDRQFAKSDWQNLSTGKLTRFDVTLANVEHGK